MDFFSCQCSRRKFFSHEHTWSARSWKLKSVKRHPRFRVLRRLLFRCLVQKSTTIWANPRCWNMSNRPAIMHKVACMCAWQIEYMFILRSSWSLQKDLCLVCRMSSWQVLWLVSGLGAIRTLCGVHVEEEAAPNGSPAQQRSCAPCPRRRDAVHVQAQRLDSLSWRRGSPRNWQNRSTQTQDDQEPRSWEVGLRYGRQSGREPYFRTRILALSSHELHRWHAHWWLLRWFCESDSRRNASSYSSTSVVHTTLQNSPRRVRQVPSIGSWAERMGRAESPWWL